MALRMPSGPTFSRNCCTVYPTRTASVRARAVAARGKPSSGANSPKYSPGTEVCRSFSPPAVSARTRSISPDSTTYTSSPESPWANNSLPALSRTGPGVGPVIGASGPILITRSANGTRRWSCVETTTIRPG
jgi:hypothetical protein